MFVHGLDGLDEISLLGKTKINRLTNGKIESFIIKPEDFGLKSCKIEDIKSDTPENNAKVIKGVFENKITGPAKDAIVLNSAGALIVGGKAKDFNEGIKFANEIIESGLALKKLNELKEVSNSFR